MKNRILKTFSGYIILILIPLGVLLYQGFVSLRGHKKEIAANHLNRLERIGDDLYRDLQQRWEFFLEAEKVRPLFDYNPLVVPDEGQFITTGEAVQRSPLFPRIYALDRIHSAPLITPASSGPTADISKVFENSMVGYFQFDPVARAITTPYDATPKFPTDERSQSQVAAFTAFLNDQVIPFFVNRLDLQQNKEVITSDILFQIRTSRITKIREPLEKVIQNREINGEPSDDLRLQPLSWVNISYHDFAFSTLRTQNEEFVLGYRPVVLDNQILIQGFLFNQLLLLQEIQVNLEPLQPEFGSIIINRFNGKDRLALFTPFNGLSIDLNLTEDERYLEAYYEERNRFWFSMACLIIALLVSLLHLGKLISAQSFLSRKKNDFVSAITHELKAPLTSIIMYTEMLLEGWAKGRETKYYRYLHCEADRLSRLIKNVLDYSGIERGTFVPKRTTILLHSFIMETVEPLRIWIESSGLKFEIEVHSAPYVVFDKDSLAQVIYNLCDNAIKYGHPENAPPELTISVAEENEFATLTVFDNGPGVPKEDETKIFNRFYRCENELTRESTGTGLGLTLVKEIVESNGGTVELFKPESGQGFGLKISIPKAEEVEELGVA